MLQEFYLVDKIDLQLLKGREWSEKILILKPMSID